MTQKCRVILGTLFGFACSMPALADSTGSGGAVVQVTIYNEGSDTYNLQRGRLIIEERSTGNFQEYLWGGTKCGNGRIWTDTQVQSMMDMAASPYMLLAPAYKPGPQGIRCLVAFSVFNAKYD